MPGPIIVPLDGSSFAEVAVPLGRLLSDLTDAPLHLVHVMTPPVAPPFQPDQQIAIDEHVRSRSQVYLDGLADEAGESAAATTALLSGDEGVATALASYAQEHEASWIVLTTHGAGGLSRWFRGSVADELVRKAVTPLLFLRPWDVTGTLSPGQKRFQKILVPLDGSPEGEAALGPAAALARAFGAELDLVRVVPPRPEMGLHGLSFQFGSEEIDDEAAAYITAQVESLREPGLVVEGFRAVHEDVKGGIVASIQERDVDAVVMSTHGRGGLERAVLGGVADDLLHAAAVPLGLVHAAVPASGSTAT
jgi:nucleotide-binding universal stress UspA family protein